MSKGIVIIMRGIPGSGKSKFVKNKYPNSTVCSADYYHERHGDYIFHEEEADLAHHQCRDEFDKSIKREDKIIVVDNTNITFYEMKYYIDIGEQNEYDVRFVKMIISPEVAHERNVHNVPKDTINMLYEMFEDLPEEYKEKEIEIKSI